MTEGSNLSTIEQALATLPNSDNELVGQAVKSLTYEVEREGITARNQSVQTVREHLKRKHVGGPNDRFSGSSNSHQIGNSNLMEHILSVTLTLVRTYSLGSIKGNYEDKRTTTVSYITEK